MRRDISIDDIMFLIAAPVSSWMLDIKGSLLRPPGFAGQARFKGSKNLMLDASQIFSIE